MNITTLSQKELELDESKWMFSTNTVCTVYDETESHFLIKNDQSLSSQIHKSLITDNHMSVVDGKIDLGKSLYNYHLLDHFKKAAVERFDTLFATYGHLLFKHQNLVLSTAEYYLLKPKMLMSGLTMGGNISYAIGPLFECFQKKESSLYFERIDGNEQMYVIALGGSPLSNSHKVSFWCAEKDQIIKYPFGKGVLPNLSFSYNKLNASLESTFGLPVLDRQDLIFEQFLLEIGIDVNREVMDESE